MYVLGSTLVPKYTSPELLVAQGCPVSLLVPLETRNSRDRSIPRTLQMKMNFDKNPRYHQVSQLSGPSFFLLYVLRVIILILATRYSPAVQQPGPSFVLQTHTRYLVRIIAARSANFRPNHRSINLYSYQ